MVRDLLPDRRRQAPHVSRGRVVKSLIREISPVANALTATLRGVAGHTGSGGAFYLALKSGRKALAVDLRGVAGRRAELVRDGQLVAVLGCNDGAVRALFDSACECFPIDFETGDVIQIRQNDHVILQGVAEKSRSVNAALIMMLRLMKRMATSSLATMRSLR